MAPNPISGAVSNSQMRQDLSKDRDPRYSDVNSDGHSFPITFAKVIRVDSRKRVVDLVLRSGKNFPYRDIPIPFPYSGARHFLGAMPEPSDICVVGFSPEESGKTRTPIILAWVNPGVVQGYDWIMSQFTGQEDLAMTPEVQENLKGIVGRRRHKSMIIESGNVAASSSQGSDLLLDESVNIANRRGNELILRDQDQALVVRTLQQFHVGAGFRVYGGTVQRDATFLPTQMISDGTDWASDRQVDESGDPISPSELSNSDTEFGSLEVNQVFKNLSGIPGNYDPRQVLRRGQFINEDGSVFDDKVIPELVYGGKAFHRVKQTRGSQLYSEYRIEVAHVTDGTLPVSEQTDGIDVDRFLNSPNSDGIDADNRSMNSPMVEFVLGTAVGNDPTGDRGSYARPMKPVIYTKDGVFSPGIVPAEDDDPETDHSAFLVRVKNPTDPTAPDAFMSITKGGVLKSYFPGKGSKSNQEYYAIGREMTLGTDDDGQSLTINGEGTVSLINWSKPRSSDNVGMLLQSLNGAVEILGGGSSGNGEGLDSIRMLSATGVSVSGTTRVKVTAPRISLVDANVIESKANSSLSFTSGSRTSISTNVMDVSVTGQQNNLFGGPKNGLATNGPSRQTTFAANPVTGAIGGTVDNTVVAFGGVHESIAIGRKDTSIGLGSFNVMTADPGLGVNSLLQGTGFDDFQGLGPNDGIHLSAGYGPLGQALDLTSILGGGGASLKANIGNLELRANTGFANLVAVAGINVTTAAMTKVTASMLKVDVPSVATGGVMVDGTIDSFTGRPFRSSGTLGIPLFRVGT